MLAGPHVRYGGVEFTLDPMLGSEVFVRRGAGALGELQFSLTPEGLCRQVGCVTVYPALQYRSQIVWGSAILDGLEAALETESLEYFPTIGAAILVRAKTEHLRFGNGRGLRAVVMRGQDVFWANNEALVYDFHGLTDDGQYYVVVTVPVDAPVLLSSYDPAENTNTSAIPVPEQPEDEQQRVMMMSEYNQEVQRQLELLTVQSFAPGLGLLDAWVSSLRVTAGE